MSIIMGTVGDVSRILFTFNIFLYLSKASAYYCNHDLCREGEQYCCGVDLCCDYVYSPWYFWAGVVFMIIVLSACGGLFRYCYGSHSYVVLHSFKDEYYPTKDISEDDKGLNSVIINNEAPPAYSVSAYSDVPEDYPRFSSYEQTKHHLANSRTVCP